MAEQGQQITIDINAMLVGDLILLERAASGDLAAQEIVDFLQRVTIGDVTQLPLVKLAPLVREIEAGVTAATDPESGN